GDPAKSPDTVANSVNLHTPWISKECKMYLALCTEMDYGKFSVVDRSV
ncbi:MAG: hypothetical protein UX68_C0014G0023, partial [Parcubacteria group bacterium GW2011_GWA2_46_9]